MAKAENEVRTGLSVLVPIHNEAESLEGSWVKLRDRLDKLHTESVCDYEILLIDNGSSDETFSIASRLVDENTRVVRLLERGLGLAIRRGIEESRMPWSMFYSIDLPFGTEIIVESLDRATSIGPSMVIGSKAHPASRVRRSGSRVLVARGLSLCVRGLFGLHVGDTQGSQLFWTEAARRELVRLSSSGAFFQVQLALAMQRQGLPIVEIPVVYEERGRPSRMRLVRDGWRALRDLWAERFGRAAV